MSLLLTFSRRLSCVLRFRKKDANLGHLSNNRVAVGQVFRYLLSSARSSRGGGHSDGIFQGDSYDKP